MKGSLSFSWENWQLSPSSSLIATSACLYVLYRVGARTYVSHRVEARPSAHTAAWQVPGWGQGREMFLFRGWKRHTGLAGVAQEPRVGLTRPSPPPWFCLEVPLKLRVTLSLSACSLSAGFSGFSPRCFMFAGHTSSPGGSPQLSFTLPAKASQQKEAPTMPLLTLAARHLPPPLLHPRQSGNSLIA